MALNYGMVQKKLEDLYFKIGPVRTDEQTKLLGMWHHQAYGWAADTYDWASRMKQCNIWNEEYQTHVTK